MRQIPFKGMRRDLLIEILNLEDDVFNGCWEKGRGRVREFDHMEIYFIAGGRIDGADLFPEDLWRLAHFARE